MMALLLGARWRQRLPSPASSTEAGSGGLWARLRTSRLGSWCKNLLSDYAEACKDVVVGAKERPARAALYVSLLAGVGLCAHGAPGPGSFETCLLEASGTLLLLSPWTRNGVSDGHVQRLLRLRNQGRLRHCGLGCCSLVYEAPYHPDCDLYQAQCRHLKVRWTQFPGRVLDVGFLGRWWLLRAKMRDFDVNEEEFQHLPAHLRSLSARDLRSDRNERLFLEKYEAVPPLTEEHLRQAQA
ncbi:mitochondrial import inner membrane translocase subunit Tim29 [Microcaecilia unicolor]|uniref:Mitochondrial import inner membrane translocase subunit Tim29 n=1 Tax=Microcaecilia unicolor TaxID=1415580 RepID=A0A6P7XI45_9AMPH|nr:mitochondrial import inner membrane translocase subunit Tim29 [Microcaecilia unicolor]